MFKLHYWQSVASMSMSYELRFLIESYCSRECVFRSPLAVSSTTHVHTAPTCYCFLSGGSSWTYCTGWNNSYPSGVKEKWTWKRSNARIPLEEFFSSSMLKSASIRTIQIIGRLTALEGASLTPNTTRSSSCVTGSCGREETASSFEIKI
jgi:hypothetical protein